MFLCSSGTGDISEFQYLLSQPGLDTNIYDKVCSMLNHNTIIPLFFCFHQMQDGLSLLWHASFHGRTDIIQLLLDHGAEVDFPNDVIYYTNP